ncbi:MAG: shikimate kinase [Phycisphaerae bacterium]
MSDRADRAGTTAAHRGIRPNLILLGYRGCGKSTVGRLVARRLGWTFVDTDELVMWAAGRSIAEIFKSDGEEVFRELESCVIEHVIGGQRQVISVGGGAVLRAINAERLSRSGLCVWLTAPAEELHRRCSLDVRSAAQRPALTAAVGLDEVRHLLAAREPLYRALADREVSTVGRTFDEVVVDVLAVVPGVSAGAGER